MLQILINILMNTTSFGSALIPNQDIKKVFSPIWTDVKDVWTRDIFENVFSAHSNLADRPEDYINHSLYFEAKTFYTDYL